MNQLIPILKKLLKAIAWVVVGFVFLFLVVAGIIQIPAVQTKIVHAATSFVSSKTHTRVEVAHVSISFPKSVVVEGLFLEDMKKDTLIFAGKAKVNIVLSDLLFNKICINNLELENLLLKLNSTKTDSLFNYNFLLTAFADTAKVANSPATKSSAWTFSVDKISLLNIRIVYNDLFAGMSVAASLQKLEMNFDEINVQKSHYAIDDLLVEGLITNVMMQESMNKSKSKPSSQFPVITANTIQINNSSLHFDDAINNQSILATINRFELNNGTVDMLNEQVLLDKIYLRQSAIEYKTIASSASAPSQTTPVALKNKWKVKVKNIDLVNNSAAYTVGNNGTNVKSFHPDCLKFRYLYLNASELFYSSDLTKLTVNKFHAIDQNDFAITQFQTHFKMDNKSIRAQNIVARTTNSSLAGNLNLQYESLELLKDSLPELILNVAVKQAGLSNADILYFSPALGAQSFFKSTRNITHFSGLLFGKVKNLKGRNIVLKTGEKTVLETDFNIVGLPDVASAYFVFDHTKLRTGKKDVQMMGGNSIPASVNLPADMAMLINFKGKLKSFETALDMTSTYGAASLKAKLDPKENFSATINTRHFDVGSLLKNNEMFGPVTLTGQVTGQGLSSKTIHAHLKADVSEIYLNKYTYHQLAVDGTASENEFSGNVQLNDENALLNFEGMVNLTPKKEEYNFHLNVQGADLQKLNFTTDDIRIAMDATANFKGGTVDKLNGTAGLTRLIVTHNAKKYLLDSVLVATVNAPNNSEININSALIGLKYKGSISPSSLSDELMTFMNAYFPFTAKKTAKKKVQPSNFAFEIQLHNHPILSEVLMPELKEFEPGLITGSFDSQKKELKLNAFMKHILYGSTEIKDLAFDLLSDSAAINYKLTSSAIANSQINFSNFLFDGKLADNKILANISSVDALGSKKLLVKSQITKINDNFRLALDPDNFYLMNNRWDIAADNFVEFGKPGFRIHHLLMNNGKSELNIASVNDVFNDDIHVGIKNFMLEDITRIVQKDSILAKGNVDGNVVLKRVNKSYGLIADANITNLFVRSVAIGNLALKADNPTTERFDVQAKLSGADNNLTASGFFIPNGGSNSLNVNADIQSLSMKTVEAFSMEQFTQASGTATGKFAISGSTSAPEVNGWLTFNNVFLKPTYLNNRLELKHETVQLKTDGIYFNKFSLYDVNQHVATIDGEVKMKNFSDFNLGLHVNSNDFMLFNTAANDNKAFFGRMIIDSKIDISGPMSLPVINARLKMKKGSNFTFAVPEDKLITDKGEDAIEFDDSVALSSILFRKDKTITKNTSFSGFDLSSIIEVDKEATLRLLMDPTSSDSLVVKGDAALSFAMDRSGKMSLTGAYNLNEGSYLISLEQVIKRKFTIIPGSTIVWNGDPMDADIHLNATYAVRAAPYDLVADQMTGLSDLEKGGYKQMYPFLVMLKLRAAILKPEITFEIQLPPEEKGILGGAVNQKLTMLNEDPSLLNKQVFALLVLGRFVQENPLSTESGGTSTLVRSTVGNFLSAQLNQLSSKIVKGVDLNFNVQSFDDYQTGQAQGRTQVEIGLKKQLFNDRLSVQLGGTVDVEGDKAKQNSASEITSDITVEYKLTKDGAYRLKGFRHNQYEGAIEGQLVETGVGAVYVKDFDKWTKKKKK